MNPQFQVTAFSVIIVLVLVSFFRARRVKKETENVFRLIANTLADPEERYPVFDVKHNVHKKKQRITVSSTHAQDQLFVYVMNILKHDGFRVFSDKPTDMIQSYRATNPGTRQVLYFKISEAPEASDKRNPVRTFLISQT